MSEKEQLRIQKLYEYQILDTPAEELFDDIVLLAAQVTESPMALISLVDTDRVWFKAKIGISASQNSRTGSLCAEAILHQDITVIPDTRSDARFANNAMVTGEPHLRFYAGAPIRTLTGETLGTLCVMDTHPRDLSPAQLNALRAFARQVTSQLEFRLKILTIAKEIKRNQENELRLKNSKQFTSFALDALSKQFCVLDKNGTVLAVNKPWLDFESQCSSGQCSLAIGQNYLALLEAGELYHRDGTSYRDKIRLVIAGLDYMLTFEYACTIAGDKNWFIGKIIPFPGHKLGSVIITHENITDYKRLQHRFEQAVESAPNAIVMINALGEILMINIQTEILFGYSRDELLGQPIEILLPERFRNQHTGFREAFFANPKSRPMSPDRELFALRKDGSEFPVEIGLGLIDDAQGPIVLGSIIDITQRKQANDLLRDALKEKELLLKEVYHRVKNNLQVVSSLINLQANNVSNPETVDLLLQSADRIKSMALLHEKLYQSKDLAKIDFKEYIDNLIEHLWFGHGVSHDRIQVCTQVQNVFLDVDTAIPCGLIINELLTNALKHAFPGNRSGEIQVNFNLVGNEFILQIADNGIGFPEGRNLTNSASLGLQLVATLTNQLMGTMTLDTLAGSKLTLHFSAIADQHLA